MLAVHIAVSVLPVLMFLGALSVMDSFKLVPMKELLTSIGIGAGASLVAYLVNTQAVAYFDLSNMALTRYVGPAVEEILKNGVLFALILRHRVGFLVDAAIHGFAIGAGFACIENIYYVSALPDATIWTWIVRGFGTAIMHGGVGVVAAVITKTLADRTAREREPDVVLENPRVETPAAGSSSHGFPPFWVVLPGLLAAIVVHSGFNHFPFEPLIMTGLVVLIMPPFAAAVFSRSEDVTRGWITEGFDADQELLRLITSGGVADSRVGRYLGELQSRFPGAVIVDMLCLLQLEMELSIRAKGVLMMRQAGFAPPADPSLKDKLIEITYLEKSVGPTGMLAINPFLRTSGRDRWQRRVLDGG